MSQSAGIATDQELAQLPRWAMIAYAARGARRALPAFAARWTDAGDEHVRSLRSSLEVVERACAAPGTVGFEQLHAADKAAADVALAAARAAHAGVDPSGGGEPDARIVQAMQLARAVSGAASAGKSATAGDDRFAAGSAADAVAFAEMALESDAFAASARRDFEMLREQARTNGWSAESAVDPATLGPEWADGAPAGWPG